MPAAMHTRECIALRATELFMRWNLTSDCCSGVPQFSCSNFHLIGFCCGCCCFEHVERSSAVFGCPTIFQICPRCKPESPSWFQLDAGLFFKQVLFETTKVMLGLFIDRSCQES